MDIKRRTVLAGMAASLAVGPAAAAGKRNSMYGLIGKMIARPGERDALSAILIAGVAGMPGCLSYVVAADPTNADTIWITEVWESKDLHAASLALPSVKDAIMKGRPLIAGMESVAETLPVGGFGLVAQR
jgi:quinol monooxygenase YgiN